MSQFECQTEIEILAEGYSIVRLIVGIPGCPPIYQACSVVRPVYANGCAQNLRNSLYAGTLGERAEEARLLLISDTDGNSG
jgi:hypothetical protein